PKAAHILEYLILTLLLVRAQRSQLRPLDRRGYLVAFAIATLYAMSDEFHQSNVPGRTASVWDVTVDALGAAAALPIASLLRRDPRTAVGLTQAVRHSLRVSE
ncbi:MAG: VanZ family protein, partial [Chloroflexota bacterium]